MGVGVGSQRGRVAAAGVQAESGHLGLGLLEQLSGGCGRQLLQKGDESPAHDADVVRSVDNAIGGGCRSAGAGGLDGEPGQLSAGNDGNSASPWRSGGGRFEGGQAVGVVA